MLMIGRAILGRPKLLLDRRADRGTGAEHRGASERRLQGIEQENGAGDRRAEPAAGVRHLRTRCTPSRRAGSWPELVGAEVDQGREFARDTSNDARNSAHDEHRCRWWWGILLAFSLLALHRVFLPLPFVQRGRHFFDLHHGLQLPAGARRVHLVRAAGLSGGRRLCAPRSISFTSAPIPISAS